MAEKVFPSAKPVAESSGGKPMNGGSFPPTKGQLYGANRPVYRLPAPATKSRRHRRDFCCRCCLWTVVALLIFCFLIVITGVVLYLLYRPHYPSFSVSSLKIDTFNFSSSTQILTTRMNLNVTAKNPNKKITFSYTPMSFSVLSRADDIVLGAGTVVGFNQRSKSSTLLKAVLLGSGDPLDDKSAKQLKNVLSNKVLQLRMTADSKVTMKLGAIKLPRVRIKVNCNGIKGSVPTGNSSSIASLANSSCKVDVRFKIWMWTV